MVLQSDSITRDRVPTVNIPGETTPANAPSVEDLWPVLYRVPTIGQLMLIADPTDDHDLLAVEWPCACKGCLLLDELRADYEMELRDAVDPDDYDEGLWDDR